MLKLFQYSDIINMGMVNMFFIYKNKNSSAYILL